MLFRFGAVVQRILLRLRAISEMPMQLFTYLFLYAQGFSDSFTC
jgi:hypothetical protein